MILRVVIIQAAPDPDAGVNGEIDLVFVVCAAARVRPTGEIAILIRVTVAIAKSPLQEFTQLLQGQR